MTGTEGATQRLRDHPDDLFGLVGATSDHLAIDPAFVEKDFWVTELLRSVAQPLAPHEGGDRDVVAIFKGGTSLSKAFGLIERFSEDVDILLACGSGLGAARRDRALKEICQRAARHLGLDEASCVPAGATTGVKRNMRYMHPRAYESNTVTTGVLLEMGIRGGPEPRETRTVSSMVASYAISILAEPDDLWQEFASIEISVLAPERTLLEKVALLHDRAIQLDRKPDAFDGVGRHYYDVFKLLSDGDVIARLEAYEGGAAALSADIDDRSQASGFEAAPRPGEGYAKSPAFALGSKACEAGRTAYANVARLVWGECPSFDECLSLVQKSATIL